MGRTYQSIVINAPAETVWGAIRNFHDMGWAPNVITGVGVVGDKKGNEVGARRVLNGVFHETLLEVKDEDRTFAYSIDDGPSPLSKTEISNYVGRVSVRPVTEGRGAFVEWSSQWERNDKATAEFCHGVYVAPVCLNGAPVKPGERGWTLEPGPVIQERLGVSALQDIFALGSADEVRGMATRAGFRQVEVEPMAMTARFPNPDAFLAGGRP
ncbi:MAG: SRPBCC family protein [Acidobacteriota bacterium]